MLRRFDHILTNIADTCYSILRVIIGFTLSNIASCSTVKEDCLILGNGPSLKDLLPLIIKKQLTQTDIFCVNFFANDPAYHIIKPSHYVLLDPLFWLNDLPEKIMLDRNSLIEQIFNKTDWNLTLFVPSQAKPTLQNHTSHHVKIVYFNRTPITGFKPFRHICYKLNLGMPVPQNVLVAAIFIATQINYKAIYIAGADHSWHKELTVGNDNILYVKQKHFNDLDTNQQLPFYKPGHNETFKMHEIFTAWSRVFKSYTLIDIYAKSKCISIFNISKDSFIDAFTRVSANEALCTMK